MKIGIEVQRLFRLKKFGIELSSLELIRKMRELEPNHQFVVFARDDEDRGCLADTHNLRVRTVKGVLFADFEQVFLPIAVRHEQVDVLHCTGNTAPFFCPAPVVQTLHDVIFMDRIPENDSFYQRFGNYYRRQVVPLITPKSQAIITVSEHEKKRIVQRLGIDPALVHVVYNGIDEKRFQPVRDQATRSAVRTKYNLPEEYILFLGNQSHRKNPHRAVEAYVRYCAQCEHPLPLVTPGLPAKFIAGKLRELDLPYDRNRFITPGYISDADLPVVYGMSTIFLFPSLSEGFGMPVIEAMACGVPVITSAASSLPEIAGSAAMLVDPSDAVALAGALLAMSSREALRKQKIEEGLANAKRFSWNRSAEKILSLYEEVYIHTHALGRESRHLHKRVAT